MFFGSDLNSFFHVKKHEIGQKPGKHLISKMEVAMWACKASLFISQKLSKPTLLETNMAPETLGLEDEFLLGKASGQVLCEFWGVYPVKMNKKSFYSTNMHLKRDHLKAE